MDSKKVVTEPFYSALDKSEYIYILASGTEAHPGAVAMSEVDLKEALSTPEGAAQCAIVWAAKAAAAKDPKEAAEWATAAHFASLTAEALASKNPGTGPQYSVGLGSRAPRRGKRSRPEGTY